MSAATSPKLMTVEEFLALPDDGVERWLIRGELREKQDTDMTRRNKLHSITEARITGILSNWLHRQPEPRGEVVCGEPRIIIRQSPATVSACVDIAIISYSQAYMPMLREMFSEKIELPPGMGHIDVFLTADESYARDAKMIEGPPVMIAEVLSPHDTQEEVGERVEEYLECGVKVVWVVNPYFRTVTVHRPKTHPLALDARDILDGDPELPGFSCPAADFFR
jgi:Uma2 family endonuclease